MKVTKRMKKESYEEIKVLKNKSFDATLPVRDWKNFSMQLSKAQVFANPQDKYDRKILKLYGKLEKKINEYVEDFPNNVEVTIPLNYRDLVFLSHTNSFMKNLVEETPLGKLINDDSIGYDKHSDKAIEHLHEQGLRNLMDDVLGKILDACE